MVRRDFEVTLSFGVPGPALFEVLIDPARRPEWQRSLRRVKVLDPGPPHVGQRWVDDTWAGITSRLETTALARTEDGGEWAERGGWKGVHGGLGVTIRTVSTGCELRAEGFFTGSGVWAIPARIAALAASREISGDLRRAAALAGQG